MLRWLYKEKKKFSFFLFIVIQDSSSTQNHVYWQHIPGSMDRLLGTSISDTSSVLKESWGSPFPTISYNTSICLEDWSRKKMT